MCFLVAASLLFLMFFFRGMCSIPVLCCIADSINVIISVSQKSNDITMFIFKRVFK